MDGELAEGSEGMEEGGKVGSEPGPGSVREGHLALPSGAVAGSWERIGDGRAAFRAAVASRVGGEIEGVAAAFAEEG